MALKAFSKLDFIKIFKIVFFNMKSFSFIAMFLVAPSCEFPAANLLDGLQRVSIKES